MLWIDKYQPRHLNELSCHPEITNHLEQLTKKNNLPHMLFYGCSGAGKKTRIMAVLRAVFGDAIDKVKAETITPEGVNAEFTCCSSLYHHQISAAELGTKDRICVQYLIKQLASQRSAMTFTIPTNNIKAKYRVFVIQEAEKLSNEAQAGLRRTLERCISNARVILHCQNLSAILPPLRSRCLCVRVPLPTEAEISSCLNSICRREQLSMPQDYLQQIVTKSKRNIRRAILMLEVASMQRLPPIESLTLPWELQCKEIVQKVLKNQGMKSLLEIREMLYELLTQLIPAELILEVICKDFVNSTDALQLKADYVRAASHYAYTLKIGSKDVWHLESFVAQCMNFWKRNAVMAQQHSRS